MPETAPLADRLCRQLADRLAADPAVRRLTDGRVYTAADTVAGTPCLLVTTGKDHGKAPGGLRQVDVKVEHRAPTQAELHALCVAAQAVVNGIRAAGDLMQCVLTDTGKEDDLPGGGASRTDRYGAFTAAD